MRFWSGGLSEWWDFGVVSDIGFLEGCDFLHWSEW